MKYINLTKDRQAIVDDEDFEYLNQWKWHCSTFGRAVRRSSRKLGKQTNIYMSRLIMGNPKDMYVDHINGNTLDNRKENLRICTNAQNQCNRERPSNNVTGYKGVSLITWRNLTRPFMATLVVNKKFIRLGRYKTAKEAAIAYNEAARKYHGEYSRLNEI